MTEKVDCDRAAAVRAVSTVAADFSGWIWRYACEECSGYTHITLVRDAAYITERSVNTERSNIETA